MAGILAVSARHGPERLTTGKELLGFKPMSVHCYRIGSTLIDAGAPLQAEALLDHLEGTIETVTLTHHHEDHIGLAGPLSDLGAEVLAPEGTVPWLADGVRVPLYRRYTWGTPEPVEAAPVPAKVRTGDVLLERVATPGHAPEHVAYHAPEEGWLFCGDAYLGHRTELRAKEDLEAMVQSLRRLVELQPDVMFPGHGPTIEEPVKVLKATIARFEQLRDRAHAMASDGFSVKEIQHQLLGREGFLAWFSQGDFRKRHLVEKLLAWEPRPVP